MPRQEQPTAVATKRGRGQPKKNIDLDQLEKLCQLQCTEPEIAFMLGIGLSTFERRKSQSQEMQEIMDRGKAKGLISLRRAQFQNALNGNATMQIWLGKQHLGQREKQEHEITGKDGQPISAMPLEIKVVGIKPNNS